MNFWKYIFFITLIGVSKAYSIEDPISIPVDTILLKEVEVKANKLAYFTTGAKMQEINPVVINEYNSSNLSELLSQITSVSVKSYGLAGQSSISLRGLHSKHTAVLWNGLNLQNTMNGGFDMNSFPTFFIDGISVQHGGSGALFGSGAASGVIHLNNSLKLDSSFTFEFQQGISSYTNLFEGVKLKYSNKQFASATRAFYKYGKNDFEYVNTQQFGNPTIRQDNASSNQYGILQSNIFKINNSQKISTDVLAQKHYLEIPTRTTGTSSGQNQDTETLKISTVWNRNGEISSWYSRFFYNYESLVYRDPDISLVSEMKHFSLVGEIENKLSIRNYGLLNLGLNHTYERVNTSNYGKIRFRNRTSLFSSLKLFTPNEKLSAILSLRNELIDNKLAPFTYSLSLNFLPFDFIQAYGNISRTYNNPTFNDLYWFPGGDSSLEPEDGWSWDLGTKLDFGYKRNKISLDLTYFESRINNHIIWLPDITGDWSATNIEKLRSRGVESALTYQHQIRNYQFNLNLRYTYTKSTYEESGDIEFESIGKQLIYIPLHKAYAGMSVSYKKIYIKFYNNYVGERYTSKNNSKSIEPYLLSDLALGTKAQIKSSSYYFSFKINNLFNVQYEVMAYYPMPLRHYSVNITYQLNKPNN